MKLYKVNAIVSEQQTDGSTNGILAFVSPKTGTVLYVEKCSANNMFEKHVYKLAEDKHALRVTKTHNGSLRTVTLVSVELQLCDLEFIGKNYLEVPTDCALYSWIEELLRLTKMRDVALNLLHQGNK